MASWLAEELDLPASWPALEGWDGPAIQRQRRLRGRFVARNRAGLGVPDGERFAVHRYDTGRGQAVVRVSWQAEEDNSAASDIAPLRAVATGTTLVADTKTGRVLSLLRSDSARTRAIRPTANGWSAGSQTRSCCSRRRTRSGPTVGNSARRSSPARCAEQ